jgi:hypothetical protein
VQHNVRASQVFFRSALSYGLVNLMPLVPGTTATAAFIYLFIK